jgi:hypothetical protein
VERRIQDWKTYWRNVTEKAGAVKNYFSRGRDGKWRAGKS